MTSLIEICRAAIPNLEPRTSLVNNELHDRLYVPREEPTMNKLKLRLELGAIQEKSKLIFSGHIGSGKSTELFHLKRQLEAQNRATIIFFSVRSFVNVVGMDAARLLESIARALEQEFVDRGERRSREAFEEKVRRARETFRRVRRHAESVRIEAGIAPEVGFASGKVGAESQRGRDEEFVYENEPDPERMLEIVNSLINEVREKRKGAPVLLFVDDLEKLDLTTALHVFSEGLVLSEVDACMVMTVPIALLYSEFRKQSLGHFDDTETVLPLIKVRDKHGKENRDGLDRMRRMILPRIPELDRLLPAEAFDHLALATGGVLRDLISMLRELCLRAVSENRQQAMDLATARKVESVIRNNFLRQVPRALIPRLAVVRDAKDLRGGGMDDELARLLNLAAVLEYANDDTWYRIHPLVDHLIGS